LSVPIVNANETIAPRDFAPFLLINTLVLIEFVNATLEALATDAPGQQLTMFITCEDFLLEQAQRVNVSKNDF